MLLFLVLLGCKSAVCEGVPSGESPCGFSGGFEQLPICWGVARCVYDPSTGEELGHNEMFARCIDGDLAADIVSFDGCDLRCIDGDELSADELAGWPCANPPPSR